MKARQHWTAAQTAHYNAWRKPLEDSYADVIAPLAAKYGAIITDTDVVIITEMLAGQYNIPGYGANDVTVSVCSPAGNMQIGDYNGWTVTVFDYAISGAMVMELHKKGADTAWILNAVDRAMRRGGAYTKARINRLKRQESLHRRQHVAHNYRVVPGPRGRGGYPRCPFCDAAARAERTA